MILFDTMHNDINNKFLVSIFLVVWIFIGNFILLNLFLAILLDSFLEEDEEEENHESLKERLQAKHERAVQRKKKKHAKRVFMNEIMIGLKKPKTSAIYFGQEKAESEEDLEDLDEEQIVAIFKQEGLISKSKEEKKQIEYFVGIECQ